MPTVAGTARGLRGRPLGRILVFAALIAALFFVSRGCQRSYQRITQDQAVAIAERAIDFKPTGYTLRLIPRGVIKQRRAWAVSLWTRNAQGGYGRLSVVLLDANTGKVIWVRNRR